MTWSLLVRTKPPATAASFLARTPRRSAVGVAPGRDAALQPFQAGGERDAEEHQQNDRHERLVHVEDMGVARDHVTKAADGSVELGDHHADQPAANSETNAGGDVRPVSYTHLTLPTNYSV